MVHTILFAIVSAIVSAGRLATKLKKAAPKDSPSVTN